jgi:hypothetical protein
LAHLEAFLLESNGHLLRDDVIKTERSVEDTVQLELLGSWEALSRHYVSAALSVSTGPAAFGRRIIAYGVLLEQIDLARFSPDNAAAPEQLLEAASKLVEQTEKTWKA